VHDWKTQKKQSPIFTREVETKNNNPPTRMVESGIEGKETENADERDTTDRDK
jgi:hypothetical protein